MQLFVSHKIDQPLILPLSYHHVLQSIIFRTLEIFPEYSKFLHDCGYGEHARTYKMYTFSLLKGKYCVRGNNIVFYEKVGFEIRSVERRFLMMLKEGFEKNGITYFGQHYSQVETTLQDFRIDAEELQIQMKSPICLYSTDTITGKTTYYSPLDNGFSSRLNESFHRKYEAYNKKKAETDIAVEFLELRSKDKYVTKYKGIYITAWNGQYMLRGKKEYLDFLYQTGLGSKNSQGFGMFDIVRN